MSVSDKNVLAPLLNTAPPHQYKGVKSMSRYLTMHGGVQIAADIMLPADVAPHAQLPTIMIMARYWRSMEMYIPSPPNKALMGPREAIADDLLARGFAVVVVDGRGTGASTGKNAYPWSTEELRDHHQVAEWIAAQDWSNGNIGAVGISYEGSTAQYLLAAPTAAVKSAAPMAYEFDVYADVAMPGGIFNQAFIKNWHASNQKLDNSQPSNLFPWLARLLVKGVRPVDDDRKMRTILKQAIRDHQANTDVFAAISQITFREDLFGDTGVTLDDFSVFSRREAIEASNRPMFVWGSWLDGTTADTVIRSFNTLSNPQIGVIGAWKHEMTAHGSPYQPRKTPPNPTQAEQWDAVAQFFAQTLHDQSAPLTGKTLYYYTLGAERWNKTEQFPLANTTDQTWYFQAENGLAPTASTGEDVYTVDFAATTGTTNRWHTQMASPVHYADRAKADQRLLTYTSAPLTHDVEVTGYPVVTLRVASSTPDAAFFVYLESVSPDGVVRYLTEGQLRGMHHQVSDETPPYWVGAPYHTFKRADAAPLPVDEYVTVTFGLQPVSALFRHGERIRIAIAGADHETFARVPAATVPVWRIDRSQSLIRLPVIG